VKILIRCAIALMCFCPAPAGAQEPPPVPSSAFEPQGMMAEPGGITRAVLFADRHLGKGDLTNGIYVDRGNMIPGAGWLSVGPGFKHWYRKDTVFVDASAAFSVNSYRMAQGRFELPAFLKSRLALGVQARWQDFGRVAYYGVGPDTTTDLRSFYSVESNQFSAYASLRPSRWMHIDGQLGWMNPEVGHVRGSLLAGVSEKRTFVPVEASFTIDTRDFPGHPTSGIVLRAVGARYDDRSDGTQSFDQYEGEAAGFLPLGGGRVVLAVHGWVVGTEPRNGQTVPFYLQPSLGGSNTLRGFTDYRFHDNSMLAANAEMRIALMTHLDLAVFADAGNVAARTRDLDLARKSFGAGFRLHTRRETFAMIDAAHGDEGWRFLLRLHDPLRLARLSKRTTLVPFVP
jgi:hypothetical protein